MRSALVGPPSAAGVGGRDARSAHLTTGRGRSDPAYRSGPRARPMSYAAASSSRSRPRRWGRYRPCTATHYRTEPNKRSVISTLLLGYGPSFRIRNSPGARISRCQIWIRLRNALRQSFATSCTIVGHLTTDPYSETLEAARVNEQKKNRDGVVTELLDYVHTKQLV